MDGENRSRSDRWSLAESWGKKKKKTILVFIPTEMRILSIDRHNLPWCNISKRLNTLCQQQEASPGFISAAESEALESQTCETPSARRRLWRWTKTCAEQVTPTACLWRDEQLACGEALGSFRGSANECGKRRGGCPRRQPPHPPPC